MKSTNTLIPYGLRGDNCIHITELDKHESGLSCNCICPSCGEKLIAKSLSGKYQAHFAHSRLTNCNTAAESGLHLKAKEIIKNTRCISAPPLDAKIIRKVEYIHKEKTIHIAKEMKYFKVDQVIEELNFDFYRPDLTLYKSSKKISSEIHQLLVEIKVTHEVDENKRQKIISDNYSCIEIDLSRIDRMADPTDIYEAIHDISNVSWIHHSRANNMKDQADRLILNSCIKALEDAKKAAEKLDKERKEHEIKERENRHLKDEFIKNITNEIIKKQRILLPAVKYNGKILKKRWYSQTIKIKNIVEEKYTVGVLLLIDDETVYMCFFFSRMLSDVRWRFVINKYKYAIAAPLNQIYYHSSNENKIIEIQKYLEVSLGISGYWINHPARKI
ncbi:hypothetical protein [Cobetia marina]|uniref:hypothetical protein n=1 Tax=Cobetia marina TaxID=28258 RepID=UPI002548EDF9|nr:hypothetical protein [Cobetia pacifica]MDI6004126.1 hypothetical protein [Cobetia pacifica]